jgi:hypothetical protein
MSRTNSSLQNSLHDIGEFILSRRPTSGCQEGDCTKPHVTACMYELRGRRQGQSCGRRLCTEHANRVIHKAKLAGTDNAVTIGEGQLCSSHIRMVERQLLKMTDPEDGV